MQMTQSLSQRMEQKLVMTRQMIQSIEMLQLPLMDLQQNINQELVANPWLELSESESIEEARTTPDGEPEPQGGDSETASGDQDATEYDADWAPEPESDTRTTPDENDMRIKRMESLGVKLELEALSNKNFSFITETYLPAKLKNRDWLD